MTARCYTVAQLLKELDMPRRTFFKLKAAGELPFLEELKPRLGRRLRFRADLVDRYFANQTPRSRVLTVAPRMASAALRRERA